MTSRPSGHVLIARRLPVVTPRDVAEAKASRRNIMYRNGRSPANKLVDIMVVIMRAHMRHFGNFLKRQRTKGAPMLSMHRGPPAMCRDVVWLPFIPSAMSSFSRAV